MGGEDVAVRPDDHAAGIGTLPAIARLFEDAQHRVDPPFGARLLDRPQVVVLDGHGLAQVLGVQFLLDRIVEARAVGEFQPERVPRDQALAEAHHRSALIGGPVDGRNHLGQGRPPVKPHRRHLREADHER
jgi:hypothetical protein